MPRASLEQQIEHAIRERRIRDARTLIPTFLREKQHSPTACVRASEFYRRISEHTLALRVLRAEASPSGVDFDPDEAEVQLQLARVLNLLGASGYALRILSRTSKEARKKFPQATGGILLSNYRYAEALQIYAPTDRIPAHQLTYQDSLKLISLADCLAGIGKSQEAALCIEKVLASAKDPSLRGIACQAAGAYLLLSRSIKKAEKMLALAVQHFPRDDRTLDRGFLYKWLGALLCSKGRYAEAQARLKEAWQILYRPGLKPESWLEVLYWFGLCRFRLDKRFPHEWLRVLAFPGPSNRLHDWIKEEWGRELEISGLLDPVRARSKPGKSHYDLASVVFRQHARSGVRHSLGLDRVDRFASFLILAGVGGMPQFRMYDALWPDEAFSLVQHQKRIEQVVLRGRAKELLIKSKNKHFWISPRAEVTCYWRYGTEKCGESFLNQRHQFTREEVQDFFGISRRSACSRCSEWVSKGWVAANKRGRRLFYRAMP